MFGRKDRNQNAGLVASDDDDDHVRDRRSSRTLTNNDHPQHYGSSEPTKAQIKRATRTRLCWSLLCSFLLLITVVFLILVEIGNIKIRGPLNKIYFIRLDLSNIIPLTVPNSQLINSIAQTLGLHDFYTVGLWNFCEGYNGQGVARCSTPQTLYWFNPVEIIQSELLAGATIALPAEVNDILGLIRIVSHWMFGLFLTGACLSFVTIFLVPFSVFSRWATLPIMLLTFFAALTTTVASVIATVLFIIMQNAVTAQTSLNIGANIGVRMFAFMWIASGCAILAWIVQLCLTCCCASRRDVRKGKKRGSKKAWRDSGMNGVSEKPPANQRGWFNARK